MNVYLPFLAIIPLLAAVLFTEADPMATHVDANPPNAPAYIYQQAVIIPAPFPDERAPEPTITLRTSQTNSEPTATPMPTPTIPVYAQPKLTPAVDAVCPSVIVDTFGPTAPAACAVAWCESRWRSTVVGAAGELGGFQVHPVHHPYLRDTFGPAVDIASWEVNTWYAYQLSAGGTDWSHWSCQP